MIKHKRPISDTVEPLVDVLEKQPVQQTKEPEVQGQKKVNVKADKIADEEVMIDYMTQSFSATDASKKTKEHVEYKSAIPADKPVSEIREEINKSEAKRSGDQFTFKDIHQIATFIINAFDGGISILLNFIARDNRVSVYSLPVETKRQLADQLALILVKYQVKFKIEFLFFITLVLAYMGPVGGALKMRKKSRDNEPEKKETKITKEQILEELKKKMEDKEKQETVVNSEKQQSPPEEIQTNGNESPIIPTPPRKQQRPYERKIGGGRRGGQKKATL